MRPGRQSGNCDYSLRQVTPGFDNHEEDHDCSYCSRKNVARHQVCMCLQGIIWTIHECGRIKLLNYIEEKFKALRQELFSAYSKQFGQRELAIHPLASSQGERMNVFILAKDFLEFANVKRKLPKNSRAKYVSEAATISEIETGEPIVTGPLWESSEKIAEIKKALKKRKLKTRDVKGNVTFDPARIQL